MCKKFVLKNGISFEIILFHLTFIIFFLIIINKRYGLFKYELHVLCIGRFACSPNTPRIFITV